MGVWQRTAGPFHSNSSAESKNLVKVPDLRRDTTLVDRGSRHPAGDEFLPTRNSLLSRLRNWDDQEGWREFFDTYWKFLYCIAIKAGLSDDDARDVVQETVVAVAKALREGRFRATEGGSFKAWLKLIVQRRVSNHLRKRKLPLAELAPPADDTSPADLVETIPAPGVEVVGEVWDEEWAKNLADVAIERVKQKVGARRFQMFDLYVLKNWPVREVAKTLHTSVALVYLDTDGELFALWTDEAGFPQIQLIESFRIDKPTVQDDRIFDGVQLDTQGRVLGCWLDGQQLLPANVLVHLFDLERFTNYRGISPIRRGANDMRDGNDIKGFQKVLSKLSTALTLAIQGAPLEENPWGSPPDPAGEASTEEEAPAESNEKQCGFTVADLVAGDIPTIPEGHELKQVNTPSAPANNIEVTSYLAGCFVAGLGLPPAFFLDEKLTGPNQREDVARGLMTRRDHYGNRGRSWRRETDQVFEEIDYILDRAQEVAKGENQRLAKPAPKKAK